MLLSQSKLEEKEGKTACKRFERRMQTLVHGPLASKCTGGLFEADPPKSGSRLQFSRSLYLKGTPKSWSEVDRSSGVHALLTSSGHIESESTWWSKSGGFRTSISPRSMSTWNTNVHHERTSLHRPAVLLSTRATHKPQPHSTRHSRISRCAASPLPRHPRPKRLRRCRAARGIRCPAR